MQPDPSAVSSRRVIEAISAWRPQSPAPLVVGIDGHGAAGKSTIAEQAARGLEAALIHTDDFFRASGADVDPGDPPMAPYYDWQRLRQEALDPLLTGVAASFRAFDWETDRFRPGLVTVTPAPVVLVEGVSATAPALSDLVDRTVLVITPESERIARLRDRLSDDIWDDAWLANERRYFVIRPVEAFDLVVSGSARA